MVNFVQNGFCGGAADTESIPHKAWTLARIFTLLKILTSNNGQSVIFIVVLDGYRRSPDSHDPSECHHLYDLGTH